MKKIISVLALSLFATLPALAGTVRMSANDFASLPDCGGVVQTKISNGATQLNLVFKNVVDCSNFDITGANGESVNYPNKKLQGQDRARSGSFTVPSSIIEYGYNTIVIQLKSNSGKTSDKIIVTVRQGSSIPAPTPSSSSTIYMDSSDLKSLKYCGGIVRTNVSNNQLSVVFDRVTDCSNFDIVSANGDRVDNPNYKLGGVNGDRAGSFTIPKKFIDYGTNTVRLKLASNSGKTYDTIVIRFYAY